MASETGSNLSSNLGPERLAFQHTSAPSIVIAHHVEPVIARAAPGATSGGNGGEMAMRVIRSWLGTSFRGDGTVSRPIEMRSMRPPSNCTSQVAGDGFARMSMIGSIAGMGVASTPHVLHLHRAR